MLSVVLVYPEIPPNTGNIIRLAANTGVDLHLVEPLGFRLDDRDLKRAGLDYHEYARMAVHADWRRCRRALDEQGQRPWYAMTTRGAKALHDCAFAGNEVFVFGSETAGLPSALLAEFEPPQRLRIAMRPQVRSLNLSNAVAVTVYEALRQARFPGLT